ncbi:trypsin-like serine protease [Variovorax sp. RB2P76]|uniref:trypsin-like serine protease n=1 Tax=Variovorax sp. RB2P76 TaxID=3443736 RepID=UPI003F482997
MTRSISLSALILVSPVLCKAQVLEAVPLITEIGGKPLIINGQAADAADYPASFRAGRPGHRCTWFLVSAEALVGAAHCLAGENAETPLPVIKLLVRGKTHLTSCEISPDYWTESSSDWALCVVSPAAPVPAFPNSTVSGFEVLSLKADLLKPLPRIEISGYGCTNAGAAMEDDYRIGRARVEELPPNARVFGALKPTPNAIKIRQAPSLLCEGDSGGPAFLYQMPNARVHRVVVGINSATGVQAGASFLSSVSSPAANKFIRDWSTKHAQKLCGVHPDAADCRPFLK